MSTDTNIAKMVDVREKTTVYQGYFRIDRYTVCHAKFDGGILGPFQREVFERGHAAAVLPYDPHSDSIVLIEQFRIGAYAARQAPNISADVSPWLMEVVAGIIEPGETPETVARRETKEESGLLVHNIEEISTYLVSPGGTTETTHLFVGQVDANQAHGMHGLESEYEDIRVHVLSADAAIALAESDRLHNAAFLIAMLWFKANRHDLQKRWLSTS